jgi:ComF family protein
MGGSLLARALGASARGLIEAAFPVACAACGARERRGALDAPEPGLPLCPACRAGLVDCGPPFCLDCARAGGAPRACRRADHRAMRAGFTWNEPLRAVVHAFKFDAAEELADALAGAAWGAPGVAGAPRPDLVVPVPLHPVRRRERGYDQAAALAEAFAARAGTPVVPALARARATRQQARLPAAARRANVAGAFALVAPAVVRGRTVALVDDVVTTGATVDAAAAALAAAAPRRIETWCVAHEPLE